MFRTLENDEPFPFAAIREDGHSPFFLTGDHAGNTVPRTLASLGLPKTELNRHIGIDIGVATTGRLLSELLDAPFVWQPYSRLVIDCNRRPGQADSIVRQSDGTLVPGNAALTEDERVARRKSIFDPYHEHIAKLLDLRQADGRRTILVALHSFTPQHGEFRGPRPWHVGVLYNHDDRLARKLLAHFREEQELTVGDNEPYVVSVELDYGIPVHGEARGILSVEIEIRQDLVSDDAGCKDWAERLARVLPAALADLDQMAAADKE